MKHNPVSFDENAIGQGLTLSVGDTILQTLTAVDGHRMARSRYGNSTINSTVEFYIYSPNAIISFPVTGSSGVPDLVIGLVNASASLAKYVGEDANGWSYCPSDGHVRNNGAIIATFSTATFNDYIGITFDYVNQAMIVSKNGTVIGSVDLPSESFGPIPYFYAATVSGTPGDLAVYANAGQTPLRYPNGADGWFHLPIGIEPLYLATEPYITAPTDAAPNRKYSMAIDPQSITVSRGVRFWPWGSSAPGQLQTGGQVQIQINDPDEVYGELISRDIRDQEVLINSVQQGAAFATASPILKAIIDHCEQPTDQTKILVCSDMIVTLQSQLVRPLFAPNADASVAGKPYQYNGGIVRTYNGAMFDADNFYIQLTAGPIAAFGKVRDQGVEQGYTINFNIMPDAESVSLPVPPKGKFTFETTTFGGTFDSSATDALNGDGEFGSDTGYGGGRTSTSNTSLSTTGAASRTFITQPTKPFHVGNFARATSRGTSEWMQGNITAYNPVSGSLTINMTSNSGTGTHTDWDISGGVNQPTYWIGNGHYFPPDEPRDQVWQLNGASPNKTLIQIQKADAIYRMKYDPAVPFLVQPGESYAYEVVVVTAPIWGEGFVDAQGAPVSVLPAELGFGGIDDSSLVMFFWTKFPIPTAGRYQGTFTNRDSIARPLVFGNFCNNVIVPPAVSYLELLRIRIVPLPSLLQNVVLDGPGLDLMLQDLLVTHGPMQLTDYDSTGAVTIDSDTGYRYGLHVSENETPSVINCARRILDSACADIYVGRDGQVRTVRLFDPQEVDPLPDSSGTPGIAGSITVTDISGFLTPYPDNAERLSTRISGCPQPDPYTNSDFSTVTQSDVPQPVRNLLQQPFQWTKTANATLATKYQDYAQNTKPFESQLDREEDGQAEITRVCKIYEKERWFYVVTLFTASPLFEVGQVWNVTYASIERLANGLQLAVFNVTDHSDQSTSIVFWG